MDELASKLGSSFAPNSRLFARRTVSSNTSNACLVTQTAHCFDVPESAWSVETNALAVEVPVEFVASSSSSSSDCLPTPTPDASASSSSSRRVASSRNGATHTEPASASAAIAELAPWARVDFLFEINPAVSTFNCRPGLGVWDRSAPLVSRSHTATTKAGAAAVAASRRASFSFSKESDSFASPKIAPTLRATSARASVTFATANESVFFPERHACAAAVTALARVTRTRALVALV
mmetsp:Transcript_8187/g.27209  ORF Transcript_8187/g.27209 Transcript_8187/m.27209 type:complete len:237 (+) Transcript_8187:764-1474(+)